jgi:hypothetical protein
MFPSKILIELMFPSNYQKIFNVSLYDKNTFHKNKNLKFILKKKTKIKKEREGFRRWFGHPQMVIS